MTCCCRETLLQQCTLKENSEAAERKKITELVNLIMFSMLKKFVEFIIKIQIFLHTIFAK